MAMIKLFEKLKEFPDSNLRGLKIIFMTETWQMHDLGLNLCQIVFKKTPGKFKNQFEHSKIGLHCKSPAYWRH